MLRYLPGFLIYVLLMNLVQFLLFAYDKMIAGKNRTRIPEAWFWRVAFLGGALGAWLGMEIFRHKTQHRSFTSGMPWLALIQISLLCFITGRYLS